METLSTRDRIVAAANRLFYREGIRAVSVDAVAEEAGLTKRSLYYHFKSKDELIEAIARIIVTRTKGEWIDALEAEGVPCGVINALPEAVAHPQAQALGIVQSVPGDEDLSLITLPLSFNGVRPAIRRPPPKKIGEHDHELRASNGRWPQ